jgi:excisionase family DNA binding protein
MSPRLQSGDAVAEPIHDAGQRHDERDEFRGPWLSTKTAARYLDFSTPDAFRKWADRQGLKSAYTGRRRLFAKVDLDRAIGARFVTSSSRGRRSA